MPTTTAPGLLGECFEFTERIGLVVTGIGQSNRGEDGVGLDFLRCGGWCS